jgi:hypothetical protein
VHCKCPLSGAKQTWLFAVRMSAYDPKRTSVSVQRSVTEGANLVGLKEPAEKLWEGAVERMFPASGVKGDDPR